MSYIAKRKNRIIRIAEEKADEYSKMGYTIAREDGSVVSEPEATTVDGANLAIKKLREETADKEAAIETLKAENNELLKENGALKAEIETLKAAAATPAKKTTKANAKTE